MREANKRRWLRSRGDGRRGAKSPARGVSYRDWPGAAVEAWTIEME